MSVVDLFKDTSKGEIRPKKQYNYNTTMGYWGCERNSYGIKASNHHRPTEEKPLTTLMNSGLNEVKVINNRNEGVSVSVSASNRIQKIEINNELSLRYEDCTKVEETTDSKYDIHIRNGYKVYNLYKYSFVANRPIVHMVIVTK